MWVAQGVAVRMAVQMAVQVQAGRVVQLARGEGIKYVSRVSSSSANEESREGGWHPARTSSINHGELGVLVLVAALLFNTSSFVHRQVPPLAMFTKPAVAADTPLHLPLRSCSKQPPTLPYALNCTQPSHPSLCDSLMKL